MASASERIKESFIMAGVNGALKWVMYVGKYGDKKLYQVEHEWLFGMCEKE